MSAVQLDIFAAARDAAGLCTYDGCDRPATHVAHGDWVRGHGDTETRGHAEQRCCRPHASYFATAWTPIFPGQRDVAWVEYLTPPWAPEAVS